MSVGLYRLDVQDEAIRRLIVTSLNTTVGMRPSREDTIIQAVSWMEQYGRSIGAAALAYNLPREALDTHLRYTSARRRLQSLGVAADKLNKGSTVRLSRIQNDNVMREAAIFQAEYKLPDSDLREFLTEAATHRTEQEQIEVIKAWRKRDNLKARRSRSTKIVYRNKFQRNRAETFRCLRSTETLLHKFTTRAELGLTNDKDWNDAIGLARRNLIQMEQMSTLSSGSAVIKE
jgi:hypothetical protein